MSEVVTEKSWRIPPVGVGRRDYSQNIERYDVEPTLLLLEGFENLPPAWVTDGTAGYIVVRDTTRVWRGGACLRLTTGLAPADNFASYEQEFGMVASMKLLLDVMVALPPANGEHLVVAVSRYTTTERLFFEGLYNIALQRWYYRDPIGYVDVPNGAQSLALGPFHHISLAVDFKVEEYLYLQCNEKRMPLQGYKPGREAPPAELPHAYAWIGGYSGVNTGIDFYIDNVRVAEVI